MTDGKSTHEAKYHTLKQILGNPSWQGPAMHVRDQNPVQAGD